MNSTNKPRPKSVPTVTLEEMEAAVARARQSAVLEERNRLAGEIHDGLAQSFTAISMQLRIAKEKLSSKEGDPLCSIRRAGELANLGLAEARRCAHNLRFVAGRLRCNLRSDNVPEDRLPLKAQHELLRIAQEAIHNAVRHANPTLIAVTLQWDAPNLVLQVKDNGSGISAARSETSAGFGMGNMRERASVIDGRFEIQTAPGHGTTVTVTVPISSFQRVPASKGAQGVPMDLIEGGHARSTRLALFVRRSRHQRPAMDVTNFRLGVDEGSEAKTENPKRATLQRIATGFSLLGLAVGFSILGTLIIMKGDQAALNGVSGGSSLAMVGGVSAILIGTVFLVTACLYLWVRVRCAGRSLRQSPRPIKDYAATAGLLRKENSSIHGTQPGDPARAAQCIIRAMQNDKPPFRLVLGRLASERVEVELKEQLQELKEWKQTAAEADFPAN
jgi:two-component sensor histidine kinase